MKKREFITVRMWDNQIYFLKKRFGVQKGAKRCIQLAVAEIVGEEAEKFLKEQGYSYGEKIKL